MPQHVVANEYVCSQQSHSMDDWRNKWRWKGSTHWYDSGLLGDGGCGVEVFCTVPWEVKLQEMDKIKTSSLWCGSSSFKCTTITFHLWSLSTHDIFYTHTTDKDTELWGEGKINTIYIRKFFCIVHMLSVGLPKLIVIGLNVHWTFWQE